MGTIEGVLRWRGAQSLCVPSTVGVDRILGHFSCRICFRGGFGLCRTFTRNCRQFNRFWISSAIGLRDGIHPQPDKEKDAKHTEKTAKVSETDRCKLVHVCGGLVARENATDPD
jgi:hypothetical protein